MITFTTSVVLLEIQSTWTSFPYSCLVYKWLLSFFFQTPRTFQLLYFFPHSIPPYSFTSIFTLSPVLHSLIHFHISTGNYFPSLRWSFSQLLFDRKYLYVIFMCKDICVGSGMLGGYVYILFDVHNWAFWISGLMSFINFGKFLAIICLHIALACFSLSF